MKKCIFLIMILTNLLIQNNLFGASKESTLYIYSKIPFMRGADLKAFSESYSSPRSFLRRKLVSESMRLLDYGAKGIESLYIIKEFERMISDRRYHSIARMNLTIQGLIKSRLNELYSIYNIKNKKLAFKLGQEKKLVGIDMFMYGTYSISSNNSAQVLLTVNLVKIKGNTELSYHSEGSVKNASFLIADKIFHEYHKTVFPIEINLGTNGTLLVLKKERLEGTYSSPVKAYYYQAFDHCDSLDARLTTRRELNLLKMRGGYNGGIFIMNNQKDSVWAIDNEQIYYNPEKRSIPITMISSSKYFNYICVR